MTEKKHKTPKHASPHPIPPRAFRGQTVHALQFVGDSLADPSLPQFDDETKMPNSRPDYKDSPLYHSGEAIIAAFPGFKHARGSFAPHDLLPQMFSPDHKPVHPGDWIAKHEDGNVHIYSDVDFRKHFPHGHEEVEDENRASEE